MMLRNANNPKVGLRSYRTVRSVALPASGKRSVQSVHVSHMYTVPDSSSAAPVISSKSSFVVQGAVTTLAAFMLCCNPQPLLAAEMMPVQETGQIASTSWVGGVQEAISRLFQGSPNAPAPGIGAAKRAEQYSGPASTTNAIEVPPLSKLLNEVAEPFPGRKSVISKEAKKAKKSEDQDRARELALDTDDNVNRASSASPDSSV